jgi:hypothetical protein
MEGGDLVTHDTAGGPLTQFAIADHRRLVSLHHHDQFQVVAKHFNQFINLSGRRQNFGLAQSLLEKGRASGGQNMRHSISSSNKSKIVSRAAIISPV